MTFLCTYSAGSHWSVLGSFRMIVSAVSFFVPAMLALLTVMLIAGSASFSGIIAAQGGAPWRWMFFNYPPTIISFFVMYAALMIWQLTQPFDISVGGSEINGGVLAEYSGARLMLMTSLKHVQLVVSCALLVTLFFGGWSFPFPLDSLGRAANIVQYGTLLLKVFVLATVTIWLKWSLMRVRVDQLLFFSWKVLVPAGLLGLLLSALWMVAFNGKGLGEFL